MFSVSSVKLGYLSVELSQCLFSQFIIRGAAVPFDGVFHIRNILALYGVCDYGGRSALAVFGCRNGCLDLIKIVTVYDDNIPAKASNFLSSGSGEFTSSSVPSI